MSITTVCIIMVPQRAVQFLRRIEVGAYHGTVSIAGRQPFFLDRPEVSGLNFTFTMEYDGEAHSDTASILRVVDLVSGDVEVDAFHLILLE
ncbi:unnamed protein product [Arctia plantaginis]|uniref:Uncharacterized protein n=1 Tax=Arctia plantaginis TaxID=874455 RepID=A0A8S1AKZ7_ARCPL|nr:unnamed protein product [Arctia plantaginis]